MIEEFLQKKPHRHVKEIPLAPVLDLLVVVIFFLVLSTSFIDLTKQTLPPSAVSTITDPVAPPPVSPKLLGVRKGAGYRLFLRWSGESPGQDEKIVAAAADPAGVAKDLETAAFELMKSFKERYASQSSVQIGLGPDLTYQEMISIMDGARAHVGEIVMIAPAEALALDAATDASTAAKTK